MIIKFTHFQLQLTVPFRIFSSTRCVSTYVNRHVQCTCRVTSHITCICKKKKVFPTAKKMSQMYLNRIIRQIKKYFLSIMYIIRKLIVKLDLKFLLSNRQQKFVNKTALMHARVLAAMSNFLSGPLRMRPSGVRGKTYPESVLTEWLSRHCRGNYRKLP